MSKKVYVVDTNIILADLENMDRLSQNGENIVAIPETVLIELEDKKRDIGDLGYQAREFARKMALCKDIGIKIHKINKQEDDLIKIVKLINTDKKEFWLVSVSKFDENFKYLSAKELNDKHIVATAAKLKQALESKYDVKFLSLDIYARMFAKFHNITVETLHEDKSEMPNFCFHKEFIVEDVDSIDTEKYIKLITKNNNSIKSISFKDQKGKEKHAILEGTNFSFINEEEDFRYLVVKPVNLKQKFLAKALLCGSYDAYIVDAKAGTGKTLMALSCAMRLIDSYKNNTYYEKIVYVRNSIESIDKGADIGYLSGNEEKFRIYNMALYDSLEFIARKKIKRSDNKDSTGADIINEKIEELRLKYSIQTLWPGEARGRTISKSVVILDEWQNSSNKTTQLILSRLDNSCKVIIIGSNKQIDNLYLNKYNNGLTSMLKLSCQPFDILRMYSIDLEASVRGKFAEFADKVF